MRVAQAPYGCNHALCFGWGGSSSLALQNIRKPSGAIIWARREGGIRKWSTESKRAWDVAPPRRSEPTGGGSGDLPKERFRASSITSGVSLLASHGTVVLARTSFSTRSKSKLASNQRSAASSKPWRWSRKRRTPCNSRNDSYSQKPQPFVMKYIAFFIFLSLIVISGCSALQNSEKFYRDHPRGPINWREYLDW